MALELTSWIRIAGVLQLGVLVASALVPVHLEWNSILRPLPRLVQQLFWVYGGYIVLSIVSLGLVCLTCAEELAQGTRLARVVCGYAAVFWGIRLALQGVLDASPHLTRVWLKLGYHALTAVFLTVTVILGYAAAH